MSIKYAILGLLSFKPQTGYELKANFDQAIRYLWNADQAQIYRTLADITEEGLAVYKTVQQDGRPNKKVYELTPKGEDDLHRWLTFPVQSKDQRNAELLQLFFSGRISDEEVMVNLKKLREEVKDNIAGLSMLESQSELYVSTDRSSRAYFFYITTLQLGIRTSQLNLEWIDEAIDKIENGELPAE